MKNETVILIVDDDEDDREIFCDAVKELDPKIECLKASNGMEAIEALEAMGEPPDFIFLDLNMPRLNGIQCLQQLRKCPKIQKVNIIIYSTTQRREDAEEAIRLGASRFITKPALYTEIRDAIADVLGVQRLS